MNIESAWHSCRANLTRAAGVTRGVATISAGIALVFTIGSAGAASPPRCLVEMKTDVGKIRIEIFPHAAPLSSANFLRYVDDGFYDKGSFYRATTDQPNSHGACCINIVQGGHFGPAFRSEPNAALTAQIVRESHPPVAHEPTSITGLRNLRGSVALGRYAPGSATSEFFVSLTDNPLLDEGGKGHPDGLGYAVFGRVTAGMPIFDRLAKQRQIDTPNSFSGQIVAAPLNIRSVRVTDRRGCRPPAVNK